ncbi:protein FAM200C-like, partial [Parasteatoda tepidariorum]|uniref:protein FAM200C-like n=1 Tax=Parasteatoda tepidariorum TaxID=114398 RepID=UPI0039BCCFB4
HDYQEARDEVDLDLPSETSYDATNVYYAKSHFSNFNTRSGKLDWKGIGHTSERSRVRFSPNEEPVCTNGPLVHAKPVGITKSSKFLRRVLDHRLFKTVCQEMDAEHEVLLYHTELRWLSRGQALKQFFMLKIELSLVLEEKDNSFFEYLSKKDFTYKLAYLADNFNHMNNISLLIQGPDITIMDATEKLQAF